jgi:hypothetical protein
MIRTGTDVFAFVVMNRLSMVLSSGSSHSWHNLIKFGGLDIQDFSVYYKFHHPHQKVDTKQKAGVRS